MENEEKKKNNKIKLYIYAIIPVLSFISVGFLATYSFYQMGVIGNEDNGLVEMNSAEVFTLFEAKSSLNMVDLNPGDSGKLNFSITNTSKEENLKGYYSIYWNIIKNEIDDDNFVYTLTGTSTKDGKVIPQGEDNKIISQSSERRIPTASSSIGDIGIINTGVTHKYTLTIKLKDNGQPQNNLQGKVFESTISAKGEPNINR